MCCLFVVLAGLFALAMPGAIAGQSLVGAVALIVAFASVAAFLAVRRAKVRTGGWRSVALVPIGVYAVVYLGFVTLLHFR